MRVLPLLVPLFGIVLHGWCQPGPINQWRTHSAYTGTRTLAMPPEGPLVTANYGSFQYLPEAQTTRIWSKIDGLSDVAFTRCAYHAPTRTTVFAYTSGQIDLVKGGKVTTIDGIVRADIVGSRRINHLAFKGKLAYVSCDFGLVVLDMERQEIKLSNTTLAGDGSPLAALWGDASGDSLFLATPQAILSIPLGANLMDSRLYNRWAYSQASGLPGAGDKVVGVFHLGSRMFAAFNGFGIFRLERPGQPTPWEHVNEIPGGDLRSALVEGDRVYLSQNQNVLIWQPGQAQVETLSDTNLIQPMEARPGPQGAVWVADYSRGLVRMGGTEGTAAFKPNGPNFDLPFRLNGSTDRLYATSGGYQAAPYSQLGRFDGYGQYQSGRWTNYIPGVNLPRVQDVVSLNRDAIDEKLYLTSYANGVLVIDERTTDPAQRYTFINDVDSKPNSLVSALPSEPGKYVRVTNTALDSQGELWVTNNTVSKMLHHRRADGTWQAYDPATENNAPQDLLIDAYDNKWIRIGPEASAGSSVVAVKADLSGEGVITTSAGRGGLPNGAVYDMAFDKTGALWLGTGQGLAVIFNPQDVVEGFSFDASLPILEGRPLLENDIVTAIAIDGGDRKWLGTRKTGIWLFDKDVNHLIARYDEGNSPLPSNNITDLAFVGNTGELFIATEKGLVSLMSDATVAPDDAKNSTVKVWPNPVRPGFEGLVAIDGLPENANVKITDVAGRLIYETTSNGGRATWNLKDYNGRRGDPGVYYVYAASVEKGTGVVGKIALIR